MLKKGKRIRISCEQNLKDVAYHEAGHVVADLESGITPISVTIDDFGGETAVSEMDLSTLDDWDSDFMFLAGCVAENIYSGSFASIVGNLMRGLEPIGSECDFSHLSNQDHTYIAELMIYIHDFFLTERWVLVTRIAETLYREKSLSSKDIEDIAKRFMNINHSISRIANLRNQTKWTLKL